MIRDVVSHKVAYSLLAIVAALYLAFTYRYHTTPTYLLLGTGTFAILYFLWGIIHHLSEGTLRGKIVLEYFLVAALGVVIVATLLV